MIVQFLVAMVATAGFAILFQVPKAQCFFCALTGAIGWLTYLIFIELGNGPALSSLVATLFLTILSRILSILRKNPVTIYLLAGIFPLVPGAGIYYTSYYFIMSDLKNFTANGLSTFKVAGAIALGIIFALAIPQSLFNRLKYFTREDGQR